MAVYIYRFAQTNTVLSPCIFFTVDEIITSFIPVQVQYFLLYGGVGTILMLNC